MMQCFTPYIIYLQQPLLTQTPQMPSTSLLKFQIGPVQDFIATARSTRDLWSGSYLLSWLVAAGIRKLPRTQGNKLIYPNRNNQPLLDLPELPANGDHTDLLTPNLPNIFIAEVTGDANEVAKSVKKAIGDEWNAIANAVWKIRSHIGLPNNIEVRYYAQVARHLSIAWHITPLADATPETYAEAYRNNGWYLDAARQTRDFIAWDSAGGRGKGRLMMEKDSLTGKEETLVGGTGFQEQRAQQGGEYASLFAKHSDYLGAVSIIKRCWHLAYLRDTPTADKPELKTGSRQFKIRSIPAIAARKVTLDDDDTTGETGGGDKYIAAIAFDGDSIGKWVNGDFLPNKELLEQHHTGFSTALSNFALGEVSKIVEREEDGTDKENKPTKVPLGQLIYAGGDDVVALIPADAALKIASELRKTFINVTKDFKGKGSDNKDISPDASAGIAIGHIHAPLQDLIRAAKAAEKRAKNDVGRPAFSVTLMKRSGEISHWGSKWDTDGLTLYDEIAKLMKEKKLSAKFPHRVIELLEPYVTSDKGLSRQSDAIGNIETVKELIQKEVAHATTRQGSKLSQEESNKLKELLENYQAEIIKTRSEREKTTEKPSSQTKTQELLTSVIGLCTTVAFANRTRNETEPAAEK